MTSPTRKDEKTTADSIDQIAAKVKGSGLDDAFITGVRTPENPSLAEIGREAMAETSLVGKANSARSVIDAIGKIEQTLVGVPSTEAVAILKRANADLDKAIGATDDSLASIGKRARASFAGSAFGVEIPPGAINHGLERDMKPDALVFRTPDIVTSGHKDKKEEEIYRQVSEALSDATEEEKRRFAQGVMSVMDGKQRAYDDVIQGRRASFKHEPATPIQVARDEINWIMDNPMTIGRVSESAVYKLEEAARAKKVFFVTLEDGDKIPDSISSVFTLAKATKFLIQHDWASAFQNADGFQGHYEYQMPSGHCTFEGRISGRRFIVECADFGDFPLSPATGTDEPMHNGAYFWIETTAGWSLLNVHRFNGYAFVPAKADREQILPTGLAKIVEFIGRQIKAVSIALEAEVAVREVVRAPHKLNRAREKLGKLPLYDYHVVNLANRKRVSALPEEFESDEKRTSPRWHFVRGHYRHLPKHKVWVLSHFRGNPDLGIIDKHYRL